MKENKYINKIRAVILEHFKHSNAAIYLFGSWERGTQRPSSDVDIAVKCNDPSSGKIIANLRDVLEESTIPYRVDVVDINYASPGLKETIQREGILWKD